MARQTSEFVRQCTFAVNINQWRQMKTKIHCGHEFVSRTMFKSDGSVFFFLQRLLLWNFVCYMTLHALPQFAVRYQHNVCIVLLYGRDAMENFHSNEISAQSVHCLRRNQKKKKTDSFLFSIGVWQHMYCVIEWWLADRKRGNAFYASAWRDGPLFQLRKQAIVNIRVGVLQNIKIWSVFIKMGSHSLIELNSSPEILPFHGKTTNFDDIFVSNEW